MNNIVFTSGSTAQVTLLERHNVLIFSTKSCLTIYKGLISKAAFYTKHHKKVISTFLHLINISLQAEKMFMKYGSKSHENLKAFYNF